MKLTTIQRMHFDTVCERIAEGMSLREIAAIDGMPDKSTVLRWLMKDVTGELRDQYARAREFQAEAEADEIVEIADDATNDWMRNNAGDDAGWRANGESVQRSRLRIDARKWKAAHLRPKVYGDKMKVSGDEDGDPIKLEISWSK